MRNLLLLLFICPFMGACLGSVDMGPGLDTVSQGFSESMRWSDYPGAAAYVHPDVRGAFLEQFKEDEDLHIVESGVISVVMDPSAGRADAVYVLEYYRLPSSRIKKWRWEQQWRLIQEKMTKPGVWLIENEPPMLPWNQ
ncbi:hypothetical protein SAMN05660420_00106 [Desulfuromusa kysingii]|uniref:Lipoprotein n=1 Tax=Desulfuromusa kysingii TaxID=37625 RepID=A0A1H3VJA6_9BACT|nr:hypothetical protein [Desulfuromusa kysingii]SDZ74883.1 hypothetical protein SAMN05660420_00106 [Desulfuromusa kysingii]